MSGERIVRFIKAMRILAPIAWEAAGRAETLDAGWRIRLSCRLGFHRYVREGVLTCTGDHGPLICGHCYHYAALATPTTPDRR